MSKLKKWYCVASFLFATLVVVVTLAFYAPTDTFATTTDRTTSDTSGDNQDVPTGDDINQLDVGTSANNNNNTQSDSSTGLSISYNNDNGIGLRGDARFPIMARYPVRSRCCWYLRYWHLHHRS